MNATTESITAGGRFRFAPLLIVALFLLPMAAAWIAFKYFPDQMRALGTTNYGSFIQPPRPVPLEGLVRLDGTPPADGLLQDRWTYLYLDGSACGERCRAHLYETRQVRLTQGKEIHRLQRIMVLTDDAEIEALRPYLEKEHPQLTVLRGDGAALRRLAEALAIDERDPRAAQRIYVIDPLGRAMMYYEPVASADEVVEKAGGMRKDMAKLLHNSRTR